MTTGEAEQEKRLVLSLCICSTCPSWVDCGERGGYCLASVGKSACISKEKGCVCGGCPVVERMAFKRDYYCTRGSEAKQMGS